MGTSPTEPFRFSLKLFIFNIQQTKLKMPKGAGLTKPMKLSAELADIVGKKRRPAVLNVSNNCGLISRKTTSKTPKTNNFSTLTKRWPSSSPLTCLKLIGRVFLHTLIHGSKNDRIKAWPLRLPESILHHPQKTNLKFTKRKA